MLAEQYSLLHEYSVPVHDLPYFQWWSFTGGTSKLLIRLCFQKPCLDIGLLCCVCLICNRRYTFVMLPEIKVLGEASSRKQIELNQVPERSLKVCHCAAGSTEDDVVIAVTLKSRSDSTGMSQTSVKVSMKED